jgi:hypothetical protein
MFGKKKMQGTDPSYIGSTLMTMSQAVFATAEYGNKPEGTWRQLANLLYGVMYRHDWFPNPPNQEMIYISDLIQAQTSNPYGEMELGSTWEFYGGVPLPEESLSQVSNVLVQLGGLSQSVAIPTFLDELAPVMGKENKELLSFAQAVPLVHAAFTLVTVFGDTESSLKGERDARRRLAADLEAELIGGWAVAEAITVASGRDVGDLQASLYQPWW